MQLWLFDRDPTRRLEWSRQCDAQSVELRCSHMVDRASMQSNGQARVLVFDECVVGEGPDFELLATDLIGEYRDDVVTFCVHNAGATMTSRLMKAGAGFVFDRVIQDHAGFARDFSHLIQLARHRDAMLQRFKRLHSLFTSLTCRETDVLNFILRGEPNKLVAQSLQISLRTVETRRAKLYRKCEVGTLAELVRLADEYELLKKSFQHTCKESTLETCMNVG